MGSSSNEDINRDSNRPETTDSVPLVPFKVLETDIPFYSDKDCTQLVPDASIVIIQALDPEDSIQELDIVPTTKKYQKGDYVTLALDNKRLWEDCWYRDPDSGEIEKAWRIHVCFVGAVIDPAAVEKDRDRIEDLERRVAERLEAARSNDETTVVN
jgi:hypothetical protein